MENGIEINCAGFRWAVGRKMERLNELRSLFTAPIGIIKWFPERIVIKRHPLNYTWQANVLTRPRYKHAGFAILRGWIFTRTCIPNIPLFRVIPYREFFYPRLWANLFDTVNCKILPIFLRSSSNKSPSRGNFIGDALSNERYAFFVLFSWFFATHEFLCPLSRASRE